MKFTVDKQESYTTFSVLEPKLNSMVAPDLKTELILLSNNGVKNIILDMENVEFVDSSGISAMLVGNRLAQNENGTLPLVNIQDNVLRLLKISQLDSVFTIFSSVQEAKDYIMKLEFERALGIFSDDVEDEGEE